MNNILSKVEFRLPFEMKKKGKWFIASCSVLDVHTQGETEKRAKENLAEALHLFLVSCFERGTVEQVLKECGFMLAESEDVEKVSAKKTNYPTYSEVGLDIITGLLRTAQMSRSTYFEYLRKCK